ncbi:MAG: MBL fold metallo-hydrolase [Chitinophagaceae bacterium]|nr:MBL fold metallo-hydrolase [Chitinophagaceae bacterium]
MAIFKSFGRNPTEKEQRRFLNSANYYNGTFKNLFMTRMIVEKASYINMTWKFFNKPKNTSPHARLPSIKTNLSTIHSTQPVIIWLGHSSFFIRLGGRNILVDPVLSGYASPFSFTGKSFAGSDIFSEDELPEIDLLIITHDHYDHLDYSTILGLKSKVKNIFTSLGVGSHLRYWGVEAQIITEMDWGEEAHVKGTETSEEIRVIATTSRHFSGRGLVRNKTLWSSFVLSTRSNRIFVGSDSGYGTHFKEIGQSHGPFDIALLESGQYNADWPDIHMMPEETVQAAIDLRAEVLMPVHWGKFALAFHSWDEPPRRILQKATELKVKVTTPMIGEPVIIGEVYPEKRWWEMGDGRQEAGGRRQEAGGGRQ